MCSLVYLCKSLLLNNRVSELCVDHRRNKATWVSQGSNIETTNILSTSILRHGIKKILADDL